ncbi:MAG TPA: amidohydrolase/deacetylase family metallohydrolase [Chloroflexota bacterium]|jgi:dihydroorotase
MYDLIIRGGRVFDPGAEFDSAGDVAVADGRIAAVGPALAAEARETLRADGLWVLPGLIDLHVHAFEYATDYGVPPDAVGVRSGVTTIVDQGSAGPLNLPAFRKFIAEPAATETLLFLNISAVGTAKGSMLPALHGPDSVELDATIRAIADNRDLVRGIKTHAEMGGMARWGTDVLALARQAADATGVPLYVHTGQLIDPGDRPLPPPESVLPRALPYLRPGDVLAHCFTKEAGGVVGADGTVLPEVREAVAAGVRLDVAHGAHFSFAAAEQALAAGIRPYLVSSDVHADFSRPHSRTAYYGLTQTMSKLLALGLSLAEVVAMATSHPAAVLGEADRLGSLRPGYQADLTLIAVEEGEHVFKDMAGATRLGRLRLVPRLALKAGHQHHAGEAAEVFPAGSVGD